MDLGELSILFQHRVRSALVRVVAWGAVSGCALAFLWFHPASPIALWRGDVAMGNGRPLAAVAAYDAVGTAHPAAAVRAEALRRSALVWAIELDRPDEARLRYEWLLPLPMEHAQRADVLDHLGRLLVDEARFSEAAQRLRESHDLNPEAPRAADRLVRAAQAAAAAGQAKEAERIWRRLARKHPALAARAHLGRGHLRLQRGDAVGALALYELAEDSSFDPDVASVASLGVATCLERLGDLDNALLQLDDADLPSRIRAQRRSSIRAREQLSE
ncbi:MAG: hypothetical protein KTR31_06325 [Myxococcales bacterium]|nr:hypothetical protein [Myxococcales bacterium]